MSLRRIPDPPFPSRTQLCLHPAHSPPSMIVLEPGTYEHTCPDCGQVVIFYVRGVFCGK